MACGRTFRHYPAGVHPYKHYVVAALFVLCRCYLQEPPLTYRLAARHREVPIAHALAEPEATWSEQEKAREKHALLAHSTIWQWLGFLAALWELARPRSERRQITADQFDLSPWRIAPHKYRSAERLQILLQAASTLAAVAGEKYSTDFKTLSSGP